MTTTFHEHYTAAELKLPSERSTGLVFAAVAVIVAVLWRRSEAAPWVALGVAGVLAGVSLTAPALLRPLNVFWFQLGLLLQRVVNPIVMFAVFVLVFVPAGAIMRLVRDPLKLRRSAVRASTYWIERKKLGTDDGSMSNQF
jgi:uncharacterized membrane protein